MSKFLKLLFAFIFFALAGVTAKGSSPSASPDLGNMQSVQQRIVVTGTVSDEFGILPGASIAVKGTTQVVIADAGGMFSIAVPSKESVLVFSYMGYAPQEMIVGERRIIQVTLIESVSEIEEVVVANTVPISETAVNCGKIVSISVAPLIGESIRRVHYNLSVSKLFD